jgi:hypothetical protein
MKSSWSEQVLLVIFAPLLLSIFDVGIAQAGHPRSSLADFPLMVTGVGLKRLAQGIRYGVAGWKRVHRGPFIPHSTQW